MSPMKIREANEWLLRLRDEAACDADRAAFEAWLEADPANRETYERVHGAVVQDFEGLGPRLRAYREARDTERTHVWTAGLQARSKNAPGGARSDGAGGPRAFRPAPSEAASQGAPEGARSGGARSTIFVHAFAAAAVAVLVLGFGYAAFAPKTYVTAVGEQRAIELSDGSRIELNTNTRLAVRYSEDARRVRLERGEAVFDVAHDPERAFVVEAAGESVRAVGTQFAVRVDDRALSVLVIEGVVAVSAPAEQTAAAPAPPAPRLVAGQKLDRAGATSAIAVLPAAEVERSLAWRSGMLQFDGQPLDLAVEEVARYTGARFVVEDPEIRQVRVWAYFRAADLDGFLSSLEQNIPALTVRREESVVHIARRDGAMGR